MMTYRFLLFVTVFLLSCLLYASIGQYRDIQLTQQLDTWNHYPTVSQAEILIDRLYEATERFPDSFSHWQLLTTLLIKYQRYNTAMEALHTADALIPESEIIMRSNLYTKMATIAFETIDLSSRTKSAFLKHCLQKALSLNPKQKSALSLMGLLAFQAAQYDTAIKFWQVLLQLTEQATQRVQVISGITAAQKALGDDMGKHVKLDKLHINTEDD